MTRVERFVLGLPAPQGSKRGYVVNGRAVLVESSKRVVPWREAVVAQLRDDWHGQQPMTGALYVAITFYLPRPKSHYRRDGSLRPDAPVYCTTKPDGDKLLRSTLDGIKAAGVIRDDCLAVMTNHEKRYVDEENPAPGAFIHIEPVYQLGVRA